MYISPYKCDLQYERQSFVGRRSEVGTLLNTVCNGTQLASVHVCGIRRAGKTWLLRHVSNPDIAEKLVDRQGLNPVIVYVPLSQRELESVGQVGFAMNVAKAVATASASRLDVEVPNEFCDFADFAGWLGHVSEKIPLAIILDDFDVLTKLPDMTADVYNQMRRLSEKGGLAWITASYLSPWKIIKATQDGQTSPLHNLFTRDIVLGGLENDDAVSLIRQPAEQCGLNLTDEEIEHILKISGYLPYYVQFTADKWLMGREEKRWSLEQCKDAVLKLLANPVEGNLAGRLQSSWDCLDYMEKALLYEIAQTGVSGDGSSAEVSLLESYGLLTRDIDGKSRVCGEAIRRYIAALPQPDRPCVFIGHGRSMKWYPLQLHLRDDLKLDTTFFEHDSHVSEMTLQEVVEMIRQASCSVCVLTAEDKMATGTMRGRQNVVHEIGLSQGILGVKRTVILRDEEVEGFTNLAGLIYIEFPQDDITCAYSELDRVLRREGLIQ